MSKAVKIWIIIAASLVLIGSIIFTVAMSILKWDFSNLSTVKYETATHEIKVTFSDISVFTYTADIVFLPSDSAEAYVVCHEPKNLRNSVYVENGTLVIKTDDTRKWYEHIGITLDTPKITVYMPIGKYGALSVKSSTGDIDIPEKFSFKSIDISLSTGNVKCSATVSEHIKATGSTGDMSFENVTLKSLDISVSTANIYLKNFACENDIKIHVTTGDVTLTGGSCKNLTSDGSTGDITLNGVVASGKISIERDTGDVTLNRCDAGELFLLTDTGDISGHLLSGKIFIADSNTGNVKTPMPTGESICKAVSDTGDIKFTVE